MLTSVYPLFQNTLYFAPCLTLAVLEQFHAPVFAEYLFDFVEKPIRDVLGSITESISPQVMFFVSLAITFGLAVVVPLAIEFRRRPEQATRTLPQFEKLRALDDHLADGQIDPGEYVDRRKKLVANMPKERRPFLVPKILETKVLKEERRPEALAPEAPKPRAPNVALASEALTPTATPTTSEVLEVAEVVVLEDEFLEILGEAYRELSPTALKRRYVKISSLREEVCKTTGVSRETFDGLLAEAIRRRPDLIKLYGTLRRQQVETFEFGGREYYYILVESEAKEVV